MPSKSYIRLKALGIEAKLLDVFEELEQAIEREGLKAFGPDYHKLAKNPAFTRTGVTFSPTPTGMRSTLGQMYEEAWRDRYAEIADKYTQSDVHREWKESHRGGQGSKPYKDGRFRVYHTDEARMTGHLQESVAKDMLRLRTGKYVEFTNLSVQSGFRFLGDFRFSEGANSVYPERKAEVEGLSYVTRFISFLIQVGALEKEEELVSFSAANRTRIALVMKDYARREYLRGVEQFIKGWKAKV